jgi:hypothetical protein
MACVSADGSADMLFKAKVVDQSLCEVFRRCQQLQRCTWAALLMVETVTCILCCDAHNVPHRVVGV